jgi:hypothetical protein
MNIFMSFWTGGQKSSNQNLDMWKLSLALAQKHYKNVYLISDNVGCEVLKDLPFTSFINVLNDIPKNLSKIWCLGKIYAYKYACQMRKPFLHLDSDVFLWEPLPNKLLYSRIFAQSPDIEIFEKEHIAYFNFELIKNLEIPDVWKDLIIIKKINFLPYNMGIFGGFDTDLISRYCEFAIKMAENPKYKKIWDSELNSLSVSCMIEQTNLSIFLYINDAKIEVFYDDFADKNNKTYKKYTHLMLLKNNNKIKNSIKQRVNQNPYDLRVKNVPIEKWHSE